MQNTTDITILLDRSGSMQYIKKDMEGAFNSFIKAQTEVMDDECAVSLFQFDVECDSVYENRPVRLVPPLDIVPRGATALYDALGEVIDKTGRRLARVPEELRPSRVVFAIITDGEENSSSEYSAEQIKNIIEHQTETYDWQFVYLGANQDAFQAARNIGIPAFMAQDYAATPQGVDQMWSSVGDTLAAYRSMKTTSMRFEKNAGEIRETAKSRYFSEKNTVGEIL
jgi:hypothetical protein